MLPQFYRDRVPTCRVVTAQSDVITFLLYVGGGALALGGEFSFPEVCVYLSVEWKVNRSYLRF